MQKYLEATYTDDFLAYQKLHTFVISAKFETNQIKTVAVAHNTLDEHN